ncbi:DUF3817 domain-containing protein [Cellulomonas marina]|uniref:Integral membrane protein n=1 Tax=Cellulomonas marina TaxID=988821 RepID=A0A1I0WAM3_9CELL|nr:DUF3817 domain-containing protein [Cellulomonas marina]GIG29088.1 hypothetical protein Cma02nite_16880 [Cellulomonas marina]SFA85260.1 integral membrane protein [Cellulomonas marina]
MARTPLALFSGVAIAEAVSWTLLLAGLVLRGTLELAIAVTIGGAVHGLVFLAFVTSTIVVALNQRWGAGTTAVAVTSAVIPYATIPVELWLRRNGRLHGSWRREESRHPRDRTWHDRALRALLRHPVASTAVLAVVVVGMFVVLIAVGPSGGRG